MATNQETKPHYLELLNEITSAVRRAGIRLMAWANQTQDPELKALLSMIAKRETSHYHIFERRIEELGHTWIDNEAPDFEEHLRVSGSDMSDAEKMRWGKALRAKRTGPSNKEKREAAMADETVDSLTRSLLRWFEDVESDTESCVRTLYARIEAKAG